MPTLHSTIRLIHISFGTVALFAAPIAMWVTKGSPRHRLFGKIYFYAMAVVAATAIIMSIYDHIPFLLMIAVFSFASAVTGYRAIYQKQVRSWDDVKKIDWFVEIVKASFGIGLIAYATIVFTEGNAFLALLSAVFGSVSLWSGVRTIMRNRNPPETKLRWFFLHMGNMSGAYIATTTAFLVNNSMGLPPIVAWLGPTAIGIPLIFYWIKQYQRRIAARRATRYEDVVRAELQIVD